MKKSGDVWELLAIEYLKKHGYTLKDTNFKFGRFGEVDVICEKEWKTYFIEVKYRENEKYGTWEESITKNKLFKLQKTIEFYVVKHGLSFEKIQFDVISIIKGEKSYQVTHYKNQSLS